MPLVQDWSLDLLSSSPASYHCTNTEMTCSVLIISQCAMKMCLRLAYGIKNKCNVSYELQVFHTPSSDDCILSHINGPDRWRVDNLRAAYVGVSGMWKRPLLTPSPKLYTHTDAAEDSAARWVSSATGNKMDAPSMRSDAICPRGLCIAWCSWCGVIGF